MYILWVIRNEFRGAESLASESISLAWQAGRQAGAIRGRDSGLETSLFQIRYLPSRAAMLVHVRKTKKERKRERKKNRRSLASARVFCNCVRRTLNKFGFVKTKVYACITFECRIMKDKSKLLGIPRGVEDGVFTMKILRCILPRNRLVFRENESRGFWIFRYFSLFKLTILTFTFFGSKMLQNFLYHT